jgi:hypothetical protein
MHVFQRILAAGRDGEMDGCQKERDIELASQGRRKKGIFNM